MAKQLNVRVRDDVVNGARDAVIALRSVGFPLMSLSSLVEDAVASHLVRLARKHNGGEPFEVTSRRLVRRHAEEAARAAETKPRSKKKGSRAKSRTAKK